MGCGILFPRDYNSEADSEDSRDSSDSDAEAEDYIDVQGFSDSDDDDDWWEPAAQSGTKVQASATCIPSVM